jgi:hypothetical protein
MTHCSEVTAEDQTQETIRTQVSVLALILPLHSQQGASTQMRDQVKIVAEHIKADKTVLK